MSTMSQPTTNEIPAELVAHQLHGAKTAAKVWDVAVCTVRRWAAEGRIDHRRIGGRLLIPATEIRRVAEEGMAL